MFSKFIGYVVVAVTILSLSYFGLVSKNQADLLAAQIKSLQAETATLKSQEEQDMALGQYTINMMYKTRAATQISDPQKQSLARDIVQVTNDVFGTLEHKKAYITIIAIESEFYRLAQSPTGPKGLAQVAKAAFKEGLENCGIDSKTLKDDDVWDTKLNLYAGACYFRAVMEANNNDPYIAIVAYNQGPNSKDIKTYSRSGYMEGTEALKYVARFNYLKRTVKEEKAPEAPAIKPSMAQPSSVVEQKNIPHKKAK